MFLSAGTRAIINITRSTSSSTIKNCQVAGTPIFVCIINQSASLSALRQILRLPLFVVEITIEMSLILLSLPKNLS